MHLPIDIAGLDRATDTGHRQIDASRQLKEDLVINLDIPPTALFGLVNTSHHKRVPRLCNFDLVILEISASACCTDDLHLRGCTIGIRDFDGATNARDLDAS